jgi:crotonobetainyl-CoA:carnitine CoA-transferase CaiB-like acyl-CoA transferase
VASFDPEQQGGDVMQGPLAGVRVLDLSVMISGPLAAMILADQGADVIKIESPGLGDLMRYLGSQRNGITGLYANNNRGKRSLVLNLKEPRGVEILKQLVTTADVLIQNFRPGAMDRLGLGYETLAEVNPRLIYVSISGFGDAGPYANRRVYDNVIQGYAGYAGVQTDPATGAPALFRTLVCDKATAYTAAQAITAALFARERAQADGQHIVLAMLDAGIAFLWPDAAMDRALLEDDVARQPTIGSNYQVTKLQDGYVVTSAISDSEFRGFCTALGHADIADDPRFATLPDRMANLADLMVAMREATAAARVDTFLEGAFAHEVPAAPILTLDDLPSDAQVAHNEVFVERDHPQAGRMREPRPAPRFSTTPASVGRPAPPLGLHSDEIVAELGLDPAELRAAGIIA